MADHSKIEWTQATWQIVTGCTVISPGCTNCYAMRLAGFRLRHHPSRVGLTKQGPTGPVWTGEVRFNEAWLEVPFRWGPRKVFVAAHGDLFHEGVQDEWLHRIWAVMAACTKHTFQVLTKRPERMRDFVSAPQHWREIGKLWAHRKGLHGLSRPPFPLPNVHLGVSVETQEYADLRMPALCETPAAARFVSYEPALGPVDFTPWLHGERRVHQIIFGGESGSGKYQRLRPVDPEWGRDVFRQCRNTGVAFFGKQLNKIDPLPADLMIREGPSLGLSDALTELS